MTSSKPTVESQIHFHALHSPDKTAVIDEKGNQISYASLYDKILCAATSLRNMGLKKGERIILAASKSVDFIYTYFGAHLAGLITVPVDPEVNPLRLDRIVAQTEPGLIAGELRNCKDTCPVPFSALMHSDIIDSTLTPSDSAFDINADADILFTTGTTGAPKGVVLSYANESQAAENINSFIGNTSEDIELLALPISHSFGLGRIRCILSLGGTVVILGSFASMKKFYGAIEKYGVTGFGMVPASWAYISKMSGDRISNYASQLRYIEIGSAPLSLHEKQRLMSLLPDTKICMHYGLTEASRSAFLSFHEEEAHLDSAGKASPNCQLAIFDPQGHRLPANSDGEVCVKGGHVCSGYWKNPDAYARDFFDGYFRTGDWGCLDNDGYLHIKSRTKEMINVGGKKVSPMEVEEVIESIIGTGEAACTGFPDPVMGEVVVAFVTTPVDDEKEKEIIGNLSARLENYKVPVRIHYIAELPKTTSGKLQRLKLKDLF